MPRTRERARQPGSFIAEYERDRAAQIGIEDRALRMMTGRDYPAVKTAHERQQIALLVQMQHKVSAHAGAQYARRPTMHRMLRQEYMLEPGCSGRAQNGAEISRVLHVFQHHA